MARAKFERNKDHAKIDNIDAAPEEEQRGITINTAHVPFEIMASAKLERNKHYADIDDAAPEEKQRGITINTAHERFEAESQSRHPRADHESRG
ncbi:MULTISPECIES: hypothetical protein [Spirulina sp. CCY15215]|uniref:hypothetical protein n=1 Tax=Spirulina sp. CCY15215 TaxID=2767591 RepID=UPI00194E3DD9|nr:hypothetical protein [Spirulina major]